MQYVGDQIEIESSTDTVEQVKTAMASTIEIEESPAEETETEKKPPAKVKAEEEPEPEAGETTTEEEETEEEPAEEAETKEEKPPKKAAPPTHVPLSRLNKEIAKVKRLERQLAEKDDEPEPEVKPAAETKPVTYCGRPKPTVGEFTSDPEKYPDPYAAHAEAYADWKVDESDAKREFEGRATAAAKAREEEIALFKATVPKTLERRPDYNEIVNGSKVQFTGLQEKFFYESEIGPDLLLYLVEHPDENDEILALRPRAQAVAMLELESTLGAEIGVTEEADDEAEPPKKTPPPKKKLVSQTPPPVNRLKPAGPGPKSLQELAGPTDKQGIDIEFNPEYERQTKARRRV